MANTTNNFALYVKRAAAKVKLGGDSMFVGGQGLSQGMDPVILGAAPDLREAETNVGGRNTIPASGTLSYKVKPYTESYTWTNGRASGVSKEGNKAKGQVKFDVPQNTGVVVRNKNTDIVNSDWPGMFGLQAPSPATLKYIATGNGSGGEIIQRNQIKSAAAVTDPVFGVASNPGYSETPSVTLPNGMVNPQKGSQMTKATIYPSLERFAEGIGSYLPFRYVGEASKFGPTAGMLTGAAAGLGTGALAGALFNWFKNRNAGDNGEYEDDEGNSSRRPLWKDLLLGSAIGGLSLGAIGRSMGVDKDNEVAYAFQAAQNKGGRR